MNETQNTARNRAKCIAFYNQKGGVGKTSGSVCCAQILGEVLHKNVLLIDFDSQGSASLMAGIETWDDSKPSIGTLMSSIAVDALLLAEYIPADKPAGPPPKITISKL